MATYTNNINDSCEDDDEIYPSREDEGQKGSGAVGTQKGFQSIVKRIQLVARISQGNQHGDCYDEDLKLNQYLKQTKLAIRRRSRRSGSIFPISASIPSSTSNRRLNVIPEASETTEFESTKPSFVMGEINFLHKDHQYDFKPFVSLEPHITREELSQILLNEWKLEMPKIVTLILTGNTKTLRWKNEKQIKNFQIGISKAAISTNMWIMTNAINNGITSYICSAIESEFRKTKLKNDQRTAINTFNLIGIVNENHLVYGRKLCYLENSLNLLNIENTGYNDGQRFELNPNHTHFIILKNFLHNFNDFLLKFIDSFVDNDNETRIKNDIHDDASPPFVSILIDGEPDNIDIVNKLILRKIPVIILKGSGGIADCISFAHDHLIENDSNENYLKPFLLKKIRQQFTLESNHNNEKEYENIFNRIINLIHSIREQTPQYLIIFNLFNLNQTNLKMLREYLLNIILKYKNQINYDRSMNDNNFDDKKFSKDFDLIIDWNCSQIAYDILFRMNTINLNKSILKMKFMNILIRQDREEFIELFLSNGFQLHKFLTPSKLNRLYRCIHDNEFFHAVCWETILSKSPNDQQSKFFIETDLNWLLEFGTGLPNLVKIDELYLNASDLIDDTLKAERKALILLTLWAVVQNRFKLVEILWKYCDHPIHLALIISMFFERLSWHVYDTNLKYELQQRSKIFAVYSYDVLDRCYQDNITLAYNVLRESIDDLNYMTAVDIAANAQSKQFLSHPCCQKWLANMFQGRIRIREITWGICTIPVSFKILLCSFFIFPMYIWVRFQNDDNNSNELKDENDRNFDDDDEEELNKLYNHLFKSEPNSENYEMKPTPPSSYVNKGFVNDSNVNQANKTKMTWNDNKRMKKKREVFVRKQPPLMKMIYMMWSAPITKFYSSLLFYIIFLILLSLASLYPNCGNIVLDSIVCYWSLIITINHIRHVYILFIRYSSCIINLYKKLIEISLISLFTIILFTTRLLQIQYYPIYWQKILLSLAILYFYYRLISIYLPISSTLGPFLYRLHLMITVDFINYMRITIVILIANSIIIQTLKYPYDDLTMDKLKSIFHFSVIALFTGPPSEKISIENDRHKQMRYCGNHFSSFNNQSNLMDDDNDASYLMIYIFIFQFFIILKLILGPLLFSIFAVTASKWVTEIDSIWKFQRYQLVIDFANRLSIPEPLCLFYYFYLFIYYSVYLIIYYCCPFDKCRNIFLRKYFHYDDDDHKNENIITNEDCFYWKLLVNEYLDQSKNLQNPNKSKCMDDISINNLMEEIEYEKNLLRKIKNKLFKMDRYLSDNKAIKHASSNITPDTIIEHL